MSQVAAISVLSSTIIATASLGRLMAVEPSTPAVVARDNAAFKPLLEAPLPDGFPTYTEIVPLLSAKG